jgi:hypothetical protein
MNFLNPLFLFGLAAAAIPVIIHLFTRRRPREIRFPSLEFLSEVNQSELRRLQLKQWLLLLLRALAVACIALAMARPALRGAIGATSRAATSVVVLCDQSGSMGAAGAGGGTLSIEARRTIEDLLTTLGPADELLLVPYDRAPHPVTPRFSSDLGRLRAAAQALSPSAFFTDHARALEFAGRSLAESHALNRELFWISDFQRTGFANGAPAAATGPWDQARAYLIPLVPRNRANAALTEAALAPTESGTALSVAATSFGAAAGDLAVTVRDGGADIGRGFVNLPTEGEAATLLPLSRLPALGGIVSIPDDALALDNARAFAAGRAGTLRLVLREDGPPSPLRLALEAGSPASGLAVEVADAASLPAKLGDADVLVLNDLEQVGPGELQAALDFVRGGGGVLIALGSRADAAFWNGSLLNELGAGTLGATDRAAPGAAWRLLRVSAGHPALAGFPARPGEPLSAAQFQSVRGFATGPRARALLEFDRAHPALIEAPHAMILLTPLDPTASDFAVSGAFLPLVHQAVKVLGRGTAAASLMPGDRYSAPAAPGAWRIVDDEGHDVPCELSAAGGAAQLTSAPLERPGLYRVMLAERVRNTFAVNPDPRESDLAPAPEAALLHAFPAGRAQIVRPGEDLARRVRESRYGRELWSWFVILALMLLVAETVIGRWGMAGRATVAPTRSSSPP